MKYPTLFLLSILLSNCGENKTAETEPELPVITEYQTSPSTIDVALLHGNDYKTWIMENRVTGSTDIYSFKIKKEDNYVFLSYDGTNNNQDVKYYVSKDTLILDFLSSVPLKFIVKNITDSLLTLNDLQQQSREIQYVFQKELGQ